MLFMVIVHGTTNLANISIHVLLYNYKGIVSVQHALANVVEMNLNSSKPDTSKFGLWTTFIL